MPHVELFPYSYDEETGLAWIFSALDCKCSRDDINSHFEAGQINENYKNLLIANLHTGAKKEETFQPV